MKLSELKHKCITPLQKQNFNTFAINNHLKNITVNSHTRQSILKDRPTVFFGGRALQNEQTNAEIFVNKGKLRQYEKNIAIAIPLPYPANKCKSITKKKKAMMETCGN